MPKSNANELKSIAAELTELGFTEYESRIYVLLVVHEGLTVYETSKRSGIPRPNVYNAVERLVARGALVPIGHKPARYAAVGPQDFLSGIAQATSRRCAAITERLKKLEPEAGDNFAYAVFGEQVPRKLAEVIGGARKTLLLKASEELLVDNAQALEQADARGVATTIVIFGAPPARLATLKNVRIYLHESNGARLAIADRVFTVVRDGEEAFMANTFGEFYGVHSGSPPVVRVCELLLRREVYLAEILRRFPVEIEQAFGPLMADLRRPFLAAEERRRFEAAVRALEAERAASRDAGRAAAQPRERPAAPESTGAARRTKRGSRSINAVRRPA